MIVSGTVRFETPILIFRSPATPFAEYLGEILCTEGLPWFEFVSSWDDAAARAERGAALLLPQGVTAALDAARAWLDAGRCVVAIRPEPEIAALAGLKPLGAAAAEAALRLAPPFDYGIGRAHGEADLYELDADADAAVKARLRADAGEYPAVVSAAAGRGRLVVFAYDLPRSVALTRQGNPEWTGERGTDFGSDTFRPADLFVQRGGAETWLDFPHAGAPAADLQQRLLAAEIEAHAPAPLPRLWHLPFACRTVLCVLGDSDGADPHVVQEQLDDVAAAGGSMSAFLIDYTVDRASPADAARWRAAGHEITVHPDYGRHGDKRSPNAATMRQAQAEIAERFRRKFGFSPRTVRNHSAAWAGFAEQAEVERSLGFRLDSIYVYSAAFAKPPFNGPAVGYLTGSGQPQKFVDEAGCVLDIYQLGAEVCDEMLKPSYLDADVDAAWAATKKLFDESLRRWRSYLGLSFHPITYHSNADAKRWLRDLILPYAKQAGMAIWSAERVLEFADARRACGLAGLEWDGSTLRFVAHAPRRAEGLTLSLPAEFAGRRLARVETPGGLRAQIEADGGPRELVVLDEDAAVVRAAYA